MTASVRSITFDCADPEQLARFWQAALGYDLTGADEEGAIVVDPTGRQARLLFLKVPEGKTVKNRLHLDLQPQTTRDEEVERLLGLGARRAPSFGGEAFDWVVLEDPEGNEFCVERGPGDGRT